MPTITWSGGAVSTLRQINAALCVEKKAESHDGDEDNQESRQHKRLYKTQT